MYVSTLICLFFSVIAYATEELLQQPLRSAEDDENVPLLLPNVIVNRSTYLDFQNMNKTPWIPECFDESDECLKVAESGGCFGLVQDKNGNERHNVKYAENILLSCRPSCRRVYDEYHDQLDASVKELMIMAGGLGDIFVDLFGFEHKICDLENGYTLEARKNLVHWSREAYLSSRDSLTHSNREKRARKYTKAAFKKSRVPKKLWGEIKDYYNWLKEKKSFWKIEECADQVGCSRCLFVDDKDDECQPRFNSSNKMLELDLTLKKKVAYTLWPLAEKWAGIELQFNNIYGIRRYTRDAWLAAHVDHVDTHIISFIIQVGQKVEKPWPLQIMDHELRPHQITLKPGDMVYYESSKAPHGRVEPLEGDYYDNMFIHFRLPPDANNPVPDTDRFIKERNSFSREEAFKSGPRRSGEQPSMKIDF